MATYVKTTKTEMDGKVVVAVDSGRSSVIAKVNPDNRVQIILKFEDDFTPAMGTVLTEGEFLSLYQAWSPEVAERVEQSETPAVPATPFVFPGES